MSSVYGVNDKDGVGGLREARRAAGLSQAELASAAGCSEGYVRLLERGFQPRYSDVTPRLLAALEAATEAAS